MRIAKVLLLIAALGLISGCTCRTHGVTDNIPVAAEGDLLKDINFAFDSYVIDPANKAVLDENYKWLAQNAARKVEIEGHCDERGTSEYNMALGNKRAKATADYLVSLGVAADRLNTVSYGKEMPLDPAHTQAAWAKNRRAHFKILN